VPGTVIALLTPEQPEEPGGLTGGSKTSHRGYHLIKLDYLFHSIMTMQTAQ